jgi:hypothetical protein
VAKDASAISAFEFQFDKSDTDTSRTGEVTPYGTLSKQNGSSSHPNAVTACGWMQAQYKNKTIDNAWIIFAHIERAGAWNPTTGKGGYNIDNFRDFNNIAPDICFGFEGAPGHQANTFRGLGNTVTPNGGPYETWSADFGGTYGGVGFYSAKVGGLWDALLGEGRRWFNYANSDYHSRYDNGGDDFYPGEYQKTWVYAVDEDNDGQLSLNEIADGLRSGNSFFVHGDLINALEFTAHNKSNKVPMGGELKVDGKVGQPVQLTIKFKSPATNNNGNNPAVDHIDLIAGDITGKIAPDSPDYTKATNETTKVVATFSRPDFTVDKEGWTVISTMVKVDKNMYFRLRGTNLAPNTPDETDADGNPLPDALVTIHQPIDSAEKAAAAAWKDLWFYSNPIFVYVDNKPAKGKKAL